MAAAAASSSALAPIGARCRSRAHSAAPMAQDPPPPPSAVPCSVLRASRRRASRPRETIARWRSSTRQ
eukprot:5783119-Pyramimonas_sp.AAC.1